MNKKGFTLIEFLASLAVIGIFCVVLVNLVNNTFSTSLTQVSNISDNQVFSSAKDYVIETGKSFNTYGYTCVKVNDLIDYGYLDNVSNDDEIRTKTIKLTKNMTTNVIEDIKYVSVCE